MNQIESYHISKSEYGIITLIVNTKDKWINFNSWESPGVYTIEMYDDKGEQLNMLDIPLSEFGFDKEPRYLKTVLQEKDQIIIYWIPVHLLKDLNK